MPTFTTVLEFSTAIKTSWGTVDAEIREHLDNLLSYAARVEREANNRPARLKPSGRESAAYYEQLIQPNSLPIPLQEQVKSLLVLIKSILKDKKV